MYVFFYMRSLVLFAVFAVALAACTSTRDATTTSEPASTVRTGDAAAVTSLPVTTTPPTTTSSSTVTSPTLAPHLNPTYYTFDSTLDCDPGSDQAALQVVQAFITAYNERQLDRLEELADPDLDEIWDPSAIPLTGRVHNTDLVEWAEAGWEVDDHFELRRLTDYGPLAGSDIVVVRRNEATEAIGSTGLVLRIKVPSSRCAIQRMVVAVDSEAVANCPFYQRYGDDLRQEQSQFRWETPSICVP